MPSEVEPVPGSEGPALPSGTKLRQKTGSKGPFYAWSRFHLVRDETTGLVTKYADEGDEVSPEMLGLTEEQFDEAFAAGSIREEPYPVPADMRHESPRSYKLLQAKLASDAGDDE